jgi:hypothetical protein
MVGTARCAVRSSQRDDPTKAGTGNRSGLFIIGNGNAGSGNGKINSSLPPPELFCGRVASAPVWNEAKLAGRAFGSARRKRVFATNGKHKVARPDQKVCRLKVPISAFRHARRLDNGGK